MLPEIKPSTNGKYEAPPRQFNQGGAFVMPASPRTAFPEDPPQPGLSPILYNLSHYAFSGIQLVKWIYWLLLFCAALWALGLLPGHWWGVGVCLFILIGLTTTLFAQRRHDFVVFHPLPLPTVTPQRLEAKLKIPVHATGLFMVENKYRRYTWLPGFYRTFATQERALLCLVRDRNFARISHWSETEVGLWYVFFMPDAVQQVRWGMLHFGKTIRPAIAITYQSAKARRKDKTGVAKETIYLAVPQVEDSYAILADLVCDIPASAWADTASTSATHS